MTLRTDIAAPGPGLTAPALIGLLATCSFFWASGFPLMKLIGADLGPIPLAALRGVIATAVLAAWFLALGRRLVPQGREWRDWIVLGLMQGALPNVLTAYAVTEIQAGLAALIQASTPLLVAVAAHRMFADERLVRRRLAGVAIGVAGMAVLVGPTAVAGDPGSLGGALAMLATAVSYAVGNLYVRAIPKAEPTRLAFGQQLFSGLPTLVLALAVTGPAGFAGAAPHLPSIVVLGVFSTAVPIVIYMSVLTRAGPTRGSMSGYLVPIWTILLGYAVLGETVGWREVIGGLIVLTGVGLVSATGRRRVP